LQSTGLVDIGLCCVDDVEFMEDAGFELETPKKSFKVEVGFEDEVGLEYM
jgi:hypothetical protein